MMRTLTVFYDASCGICSRLRSWLSREPAYVRLELVSFDSPAARRVCPDLHERGADRELIVMADDGRLWQGAEAWVTCLWALRRWRKWSKRLANPVLLPFAREMVHLISANRLTLSRLAGIKSDAVLAQEIEDARRRRSSAVSGAIADVVASRRGEREEAVSNSNREADL